MIQFTNFLNQVGKINTQTHEAIKECIYTAKYNNCLVTYSLNKFLNLKIISAFCIFDNQNLVLFISYIFFIFKLLSDVEGNLFHIDECLKMTLIKKSNFIINFLRTDENYVYLLDTASNFKSFK